MPLTLGPIGFGWGKAGAKGVICLGAQKQNPFLPRARQLLLHFSLQISATLCKFWPLQQRELRAATATASHAATATVALPSSLSLLLSATSDVPTTRDHHVSLLPPPSRLASGHQHVRPPREPPAAVSSRVRPPPREPPAAVSSRVRPHCSGQSSLSLSLCKCSGVPAPPRKHFHSFAAIVAPWFSLR
ncbi:hypothetical protein DEO72_LG1g2866 [Vigna unguiculata]|uniref:Uncharacterized protein n=1 Tax=Vigna unguiculata TaxID=3917 RepID=A0A4D6KTT5_VIGUN|nr:hypothetical protein DEO72_LG1g2866 [Vigna unguiculata]